MIYFDNAATSFPKPAAIREEMLRVCKHYGGNPGRGDYGLSRDTSRYLFEARKAAAAFFGVPRAGHIVFTLNATEAANVALKGVLRPGMHVVHSPVEHNALWRPLKALEKAGVSVAMAAGGETEAAYLASWEAAIQKNTRLFVVNHGSNVTGEIQPLEKLAALAHRHRILVLADMAQTAGFLPIDLIAMDVDLAAFAGHKGLLGPGGVGLLYVREDGLVAPLKEGGTGSHSQSPEQPPILPEALETGTPNMVGIGGLRAGLQWIEKWGLTPLREHETMLTNRFLEGLKRIPNLSVYGPRPGQPRVPLVSLNVKDMPCQEVSAYLERKGKIAVRSGLHCCPLAHRQIGTLQRGTVRFSFGPQNKKGEVDLALHLLEALSKKAK